MISFVRKRRRRVVTTTTTTTTRAQGRETLLHLASKQDRDWTSASRIYSVNNNKVGSWL